MGDVMHSDGPAAPQPRRLAGPDHTAWARAVSPSPLGDPPRPQISAARTLVALLVVAVTVGAGAVWSLDEPNATAAKAPTARFAPYVDVTLTPTYAFEDPTANPVGHIVLGFVVARAARSSCTPSWGGAYSLDEADATLDLDRRIAQTARQGGNAAVSFGGAANTELAVSCRRTSELTAAYRSVIERYDLDTIDFDIEGAALGNASASARRARAAAALQRGMRAKRRKLDIWLTLPVAPDGLTAEGQAAVSSMLRAGVELAGVNVMAMDFAPTAKVKRDMLGAATSSMYAAHGQLDSLTRRAGLRLTARELWNRLGVTVMIGRNDIPGEVFGLAAARGLTKFVLDHHVGRVSMWSLNRDSQCGQVFAEINVLSNTCSGVKQPTLEFTRIFSRLPGTARADAGTLRRAAIPQVTIPPVDDPAKAPYPIWKPGATYGAGYKVVWHGDVYQAKWFSQNNAPDHPVSKASDTPWLLLGPVRPTDKPMRILMPKRNDFPAWSPTAVYRKGERVKFRGLPYAARWYNQGIVPDTTLPPEPLSPWAPLFTIPGQPRTGSKAP